MGKAPFFRLSQLPQDRSREPVSEAYHHLVDAAVYFHAHIFQDHAVLLKDLSSLYCILCIAVRMPDALDPAFNGTDPHPDPPVGNDPPHLFGGHSLHRIQDPAHLCFIMGNKDYTYTGITGDDLLSRDPSIDLRKPDYRLGDIRKPFPVLRFYIHIGRVLERYGHKRIHVHIKAQLSAKLLYQRLILIISDDNVIEIS